MGDEQQREGLEAVEADEGVSPFTASIRFSCKLLRAAVEELSQKTEQETEPKKEVAILAAFDEFRSLSIPSAVRKTLGDLRSDFVKPLSGRKREDALMRALSLLGPMSKPSYAEQLLSASLEVFPGMGPKRVSALAKSELRTPYACLFRFPTRYDDRSALAQVGRLQVGQHATFVGEVLESEELDTGGRNGYRGKGPKRPVLRALIGDDTGSIECTWFHAPNLVRELVVPGTRLRVTGDVRRYKFDKQMTHPDLERLEDGGEVMGTPDDEPSERENELQSLRDIAPEYGTPGALPPRVVRELFQHAVEQYADLVPGFLPKEIVQGRDLPSVGKSLRGIHQPEADADFYALRAAQTKFHERLILEEFYLLECGLALRSETLAHAPGISMPDALKSVDAAQSSLPFKLTQAQQRVVAEILKDFTKPHPMHRLLQGDVGSGKTAVAFLAALAAARAGYQAALMAPTELLAEQHASSLSNLIEAGGQETSLRIGLLTASVPKAGADELRRQLASGEIDLVVGTHALVQDEVTFAKLGLAIVDEQHRFGVRQRAALSKKGAEGREPHVLVMTATPIPRTLALTLWGDLDLSIIDELPPGRIPVKTELLRPGDGQRVVTAIREVTGRGEQVYVVYPLVEESEKMDLLSAVESAQRIAAAFPDLHVEIVHGQLTSEERNAAMLRFKQGESHILVSTTVIEVGVDVPNASLMVIEHAERFGLAQLHQLRGRVGRGQAEARCMLISRKKTQDGEARLKAMLETTDGFKIADADLKIRGPGEFLGTQQSGRLPELRLADLLRDARLIPVARESAFATLAQDPGLARHPQLASAVQARWGDRLALSSVG
jgi:ATP-dependent DNA helicase RecG